MQVEINTAFTDKQLVFTSGNAKIVITPPISDSYWWLRVELSPAQAIVAFPKFGTIGIGFQREEDWNTNLPYGCTAEKIYAHISHNKGDETISAADCIAAIQLIQETIAQIWPGHDLEAIARLRAI